MKFGIKKKILAVLIAALALTSALDALLASYFTNRQNEESAYASINQDLYTWQNDLHATTARLKDVALATVGDSVSLTQLTELLVLAFKADESVGSRDSGELERTLAYNKSVALGRLQLVLRTGGFSSIAVFTGGQLSHYVSTSEAGMRVRRGSMGSVWATAPANSRGELPLQRWPIWAVGNPGAHHIETAAPQTNQPTVEVGFINSGEAMIEIAVPVQGLMEDFTIEGYEAERPVERFVTGLAIANPAAVTDAAPGETPPAIVAVMVFRKLLDRAILEEMAQKTGKWPALLSPDGTRKQQLAEFDLGPRELFQRLQSIPTSGAPKDVHGTVTTPKGSYYSALLPFHFEGRPRLILGLASSRQPTLRNVRQTVTALMIVAGSVLMLGVGVGVFWAGRLIDPIVELTAAVNEFGHRSRVGAVSGADGQSSAQKLRPIAVKTSDEIGALARAFNGMIVELRQSLETLELRVQARTAELRQQTRYLRTLIDTLPMLAWFKDTQSRFLAVNQVAAKACGLTPEEVVGKSDLEVWPRYLAEAYRADDAEVMATRERITKEERVAHVNGVQWVETYKAPVVDEDGTVLGTVGVARDISTRKAAEAAREAALAEAERLARVRSEFLAQMSHELRTPLNGILGYAQILQRDKTLGERQLTGLGIIQQSGEHLLTLINDILDFAKVEAGKLELIPTDIPFAKFLRVIANIISVKAEQKNLIFTVETAPDLPEGIRADEKRLRQVLLNLLANAVKFTDRGQVTLKVRTVSATRLRFDIQDTGIGIGPDQLKNLFHPFEQAGSAQQRAGGTGLGLAISRQLVRMMGDDIRVESQLGQGSTFWFELEAPVVAPQWEPPVTEGLVTGYIGPRKRVLVVDDLAENRAVVVAMLGQLGFDMVEAVNGRDGLEKAHELHPDLILMDIVMPEMGGLEAIRRLRQSPDSKDVPIIAVSASASDVDTRDCLSAGANTFLAKPIVMARLCDEIEPLLKLTWTYETPRTIALPEATDTRPLVPPPANEMKVLHRLARRGRMHDILEWTDHAAGLDACYQPFVNRVRVLAKAYQSKAIRSFVELHMKDEQV
jgi:PAS domain S-box-containing protein